jgi:hypothetical protein
MKDACTGESPQDVDSLLAVLRDSLGELNLVKEISKVSWVLRLPLASSTRGLKTRGTWSTTPPQPRQSSQRWSCANHRLHISSATTTRGLTRRWRRPSLAVFKPLLTAPRLLLTSAPPTPRRGVAGRRSPIGSPPRPPTSLGPREKPTALPPRRRRAS